jgi:UDP-galactopyranose mutase
MMRKVLIVGAGFSGAVIARELADKGIYVDIIDKRPHVAGNAYDEISENNIRIHKYGPHIFHTSNQKVVSWLSRFTEWLPYKHKVKAMLLDGRLVTLPVNRITAAIVGQENIIDIFYRPYTKKMWGMDLEDLDPSIIQRIPVRNDDNEYYFPDDTFQAIPKLGYTQLVNNILKHELINVKLMVEFKKSMIEGYDHVFNSMPIDEYFNFSLGDLPYRSIKFHHYSMPIPNIFPVATVNFTHLKPYTRVTEWKNFPGHGLNESITELTVEEPCDYKENNYERYYPVKDLTGVNISRYREYRKMIPEKMTFIGRCGMYAYLDMHQAISTSLKIANDYLD